MNLSVDVKTRYHYNILLIHLVNLTPLSMYYKRVSTTKDSILNFLFNRSTPFYFLRDPFLLTYTFSNLPSLFNIDILFNRY